MPEFETKDSGERKQFPGGGMRDTAKGKPRPDLLFPRNVPYEEQMLTRLAALMARGAEKYESRNWESMEDEEALEHAEGSLGRHYYGYSSGDTDEDHAAGIMANVLFLETIKYKIREKARKSNDFAFMFDPKIIKSHSDTKAFLYGLEPEDE